MRTRTPAVLAACCLALPFALRAQDTTQAKHDSAQARPDSAAMAAPVAPPTSTTTVTGGDSTYAVRPGMSEADVRQHWGEPLVVRRHGDWSYLFYSNGHERRLGYYDTVFLHNDQVVDAIVRADGRVYLGTSSSPEGRIPAFTPPPPGTQPAQQPAEVGGLRVTTPAPAPSRP